MMHLINKFGHLKIQLQAIKLATDNFADENCIGRGGFGKVYKGELFHSKRKIVVALKRLDPKFGQGNPEFWKEIIMLSQYKHENIVSLLGFCDESNEKILVYEYASRRSLDTYLNDRGLTWIRRLQICIGAARGLAYLHNPGRTQQRVLHRDIKSSNILLDENWNAKISDLGLSKFGPANQRYTFLVSNTVGTLGYCDPLYIETGLLTKESDVYSFGVVLFEVLCGRLCISSENGINQSLIGLVRRYYPQNKISEIIYRDIKDGMNPRSLNMFTTIAYRCLKRDSEERPVMSDVVRILERALEYQHGVHPRLIITKQPDNRHRNATNDTRFQEGSQDGIIELVLVEAKDLVPAYIRGTSDPYVKVQCGNIMKRTQVMLKTLNPRWHQTLQFPDDGSLLALQVKDYNPILSGSCIGSCIVEYQRLTPNEMYDKWIPLQGVKSGEIHVQVTRKVPKL